MSRTLARTVTRDVVLGGQQLRRGDRLLVSYVGANHDEVEFEKPDVVDIERTPNRHFAFGSVRTVSLAPTSREFSSNRCCRNC